MTRRTARSEPRQPRPPMPPGREAVRRAPRIPVTQAPPGAGAGLIAASFAGTGALGVTAIAAAIAPRTLDAPALVVALAMFFGGTGAFAWAYVIAVGRSRTEAVAIGGVFGLAGGSTPAPVRVKLLGSLAAEVVLAVVTAAVRPYTSLSFGILAPMWGLGIAGVWGARHGGYPPRPADPRRRAPRRPER